jgi:hypothetical protein
MSGVQCAPFPANYFPSPPALPAGLSLPVFTPPTFFGQFCCFIQEPPWGAVELPPLPFPPGALIAISAAFAAYNAALQKVYDACALDCPFE